MCQSEVRFSLSISVADCQQFFIINKLKAGSSDLGLQLAGVDLVRDL